MLIMDNECFFKIFDAGFYFTTFSVIAENILAAGDDDDED